MKTDLDHLPANKQRELERVKQIIFEEFADSIALATMNWKKKGRIDKIILYGSRSEEHTSELQSLMRISYAVFCLKKKILNTHSYEQSNTTTYVTPTQTHRTSI